MCAWINSLPKVSVCATSRTDKGMSDGWLKGSACVGWRRSTGPGPDEFLRVQEGMGMGPNDSKRVDEAD